MSLHTGIPPNLLPLGILLDNTPVGVSYDPVEKRIYWSDDYGNILRAFLTGNEAEVVIKGLTQPMGIEIDLVGRMIFYADENGNTITVANLDGSYPAVLVNVESPQGIALDSLAG